jgi:hypothetical protein
VLGDGKRVRPALLFATARTFRERAKPTHPAVIGIPASQERVHLLYVQALDALKPIGERAAPLRSLADWLLLRRS